MFIKGVQRMADLPGMYSNEDAHNPGHSGNPHNPYVAAQPARRVDHAGGGAAGAARAAGAADHGPSGILHFFFMEAENASGLATFMRNQDNMDVVMFQEQRNGSKFWWRMDDGTYDGTYITGIRITGTYGGGSTLQLQITTCNNDFETRRQGYMTANEYKKLAVFIIAKSGSTDLLGDPIMDHIRHRMYNRY